MLEIDQQDDKRDDPALDLPKASGSKVGVLINFGGCKVEYRVSSSQSVSICVHLRLTN